jgi:hypothetical protein
MAGIVSFSKGPVRPTFSSVAASYMLCRDV